MISQKVKKDVIANKVKQSHAGYQRELTLLEIFPLVASFFVC